jgi:hypothetical protein
MMKTLLRVMTVGVSVLALSPVVRANNAVPIVVQGAAQVSVADAAPFLGDWTLAMQGPNGPASFTLAITADKDKVAAEIASDVVAKQPITNISLVDKRLVLSYSFQYEGNSVDAVVSLTPDKDGKTTAAQIDFAGGAYVMSGTATKSEKEKAK